MQVLVLVTVILVLVSALTVFLVRDLFASLIAFSVVSLGLAVLFVLLRAPDVAMTEATVGAGLGSLLFALAIRRISGGGAED
jgi:multicomponent Na+:H+ antiporter subunit B